MEAQVSLPVLVTLNDAARALRISRRALFARIAAGRIPTVRLGGRVVRIDAADLARLVADSKSGGLR
jgi:excisionase family DNA binding protein